MQSHSIEQRAERAELASQQACGSAANGESGLSINRPAAAKPRVSGARHGAPAPPRFVDTYLAALLAQASHLISSEFHAVVRQHGLAISEWRVLATLADGPPISVGRLAQTAVTKQPTVTRLLDRLHLRGHIRRLAHGNDRRVTLVGITPAGKRVVARLIALAREHEEKVLSPFEPSRSDTLKSTLRRIIEHHGLANPYFVKRNVDPGSSSKQLAHSSRVQRTTYSKPCLVENVDTGVSVARLTRLREENKRLASENRFLKSHPTLMAGLRGEILVADLCGGFLTSYADKHDVRLRNNAKIEVKFSHHRADENSKNYPQRHRWAWNKPEGHLNRGKDYDFLLLVGEKDHRHSDLCSDDSPFIYILLPIAVVKTINSKTVRHGSQGGTLNLDTDLLGIQEDFARGLKSKWRQNVLVDHLVPETTIRQLEVHAKVSSK